MKYVIEEQFAYFSAKIFEKQNIILIRFELLPSGFSLSSTILCPCQL